MDQRTRKLMTHKALHHRDDIDRLYVSRKGGRGLANIEDTPDASIRKLVKKSKERLITVASNSCDKIRTS